MSKKSVIVMLSAMTMLSELGGSSFSSCNHKQKKVEKISYKGMSAEEMGTSHKRKSRAERKRKRRVNKCQRMNLKNS